MKPYLSSLMVTLASAVACSGSSFGTNNDGLGSGGSGGTSSSGGATATGSTSGTGNAASTGGANGTGGRLGTGGTTGTGGGMATGGSPGTGGFDTSGVDCPTSFPDFEKGCTDSGNCLLVSHQVDCCGTMLVMAVNHSEESRFTALESVCESQYPGCGCATMDVKAEDGTSVPIDLQSKIIATCDSGTCQSKYAGATFACGNLVCTDLQYCRQDSLATDPQSVTYGCVPLDPTCTSSLKCACLGISVGCTCTESNGLATLTCIN